MNQLWATKSVDKLRADAEHGHGLKRALGSIDLVMLGIGAIIGSGIFVLTGHAAAAHAGPAVCLSFVIAGIAAAFAGLCYAEIASMIPIAGSAYTYAYATMGELVAWAIGWDLILEYLVGASAVAVAWSGYVRRFLSDAFNYNFPEAFGSAPYIWVEADHKFMPTTGYLNIPAVFIVIVATLLLVRGIKESASVNSAIVVIKVAVVVAFIVCGVWFIDPQNYDPFIPANTGKFGEFGISGIIRGAGKVFFAYIGFDAVSTAAQECKDPKKDLPIGILGSLAICTTLYLLVSLILTGLVHYSQLNVAHPIALGVAKTGMLWLQLAVNIGAIAGLSSVIVVLLMGQPRIFFSMAVDGLFPKWATHVHPTFGTPWITTLLSGAVCAVAAGMLPIDVLAELASIGTLFAFVLVSLGVIILRRTRPDIPRGFMVPGGPYLVPVLSVLSSGGLMLTSSLASLLRLGLWMALGMVFYAVYSYKHSNLRKEMALEAAGGPPVDTL